MSATPERIRERHAAWLADKRREWDAHAESIAWAVALAYLAAVNAVAEANDKARGRWIMGRRWRTEYLTAEETSMYFWSLRKFGNHDYLGQRP